jgi:hypothetical protein
MSLLKLWDSSNIKVLYLDRVHTRQHTLEVSGSLSAWICLCVCARTQVGLREWE